MEITNDKKQFKTLELDEYLNNFWSNKKNQNK